MIANDILLDAFTRVQDSLHRTLSGITPEELIKEPHPSIGWLAWRISRVMDANVSRLSGREQLWIGEEWAARFGMAGEPADYGRSARHTREQVKSSALPQSNSSTTTFHSFERADRCFPAPFRTEALHTGILVCLDGCIDARLSNAFGKIFQFHKHLAIQTVIRKNPASPYIRASHT